MGRSQDYVRLATNAARSLADSAFDSLRDAVLVVDSGSNHVPVVLANAAARSCLGDKPGHSLIDASLFGLLTPGSASTVQEELGRLKGCPGLVSTLTWRFGQGDATAQTELKMLDHGRNLAMLTFAPAPLPTVVAPTPAPQGSSEWRLRELADTHAQDFITVARIDGKIEYVSGGVLNTLGYTPAELCSIHLFDQVHEADAATLRAKFRELTDGKIERFSHQHRVCRKDGTYRWLESNYVAAFANPLVNGIVINTRDVTERKDAERQLKQREEVFRLATDAVDGVIFEWDIAHGVVNRSRGVLEVLGIERGDLAPAADAWYERIHPNDVAAARREIDAGLSDDRGWTTTYRIRDARGRYRSMLERGLIQRNDLGDPVRAIGCSVDVSEIKRLTDLLAETQSTANTGGWEYSYTTVELTWTDEMFRIYETSPEEFVVSWESVLAQCTNQSRQIFDDAWRRAESTDGQFDVELEINTLKGRPIWVRMIGHLETLDDRPFRAFGSVQNIHAQKVAQLTLESYADWLKLSMHMAHMHAWRWDKIRDAFEFAIVDSRTMNLPGVFPGMRELMARVHPKDRTAASRAIDRAFVHRGEVQGEFRLRTNDGTYRSYATVARPLFDALGTPTGLVGVTQDVTARREAEAQLRRSEQLLRTTTANTADTLILLDTDLRIRFINKSESGTALEQMVGCGIAEMLPMAERETILALLKNVLITGETATYEFASGEDPAQVQYFENRAVLVRDEGIATGISVSVRNITERKRLEQEILEVASRERQSIGRDLHDGLGQELTGVALMLRSLATRLERQAPGVFGEVNEIVGLVNQSIESARALARGLLPVNTDNGGLPHALRALAARSCDQYGLEVNFRADIWPQVTLSEATASHIYRIAQEALTNAARHGHASKVEIFLSMTRETFQLKVTDNGIGIVAARRSASGMGLKIMRYRADMIGASFEIRPREPRGTLVSVKGKRPPATGALHSFDANSGGS